MGGNTVEQMVHLPADSITLEGVLAIPAEAQGVVLFAHGSGSGRHSPRNNFVARVLQAEGLGTLLIDLLTEEEDRTYETRFDIDLLSQRLVAAINWLKEQSETKDLPIGLFGASTGAAAALKAAVSEGPIIGAVVSRGGRPDLAGADLSKVTAPTLLIVGGNDTVVLELNREAYRRLAGPKDLAVVRGATHLFEEPGTLEDAADLAADWFKKHLNRVER
jgi:putative phosphoribosyl transferase